MELFYRVEKIELIQDSKYGNPEQALFLDFKYIELYYYTKQIHSAPLRYYLTGDSSASSESTI